MDRLWPAVYYLIPGLLLGFGLAVLPHREQLGRELPPARRWLLRSLPERALATGWLLMAATLQFTASLPNAWYLEFCEQDTVLRRELTSTLFEVDGDGFVSIPQTPGFGIELDWDALERYRVDG